MTKDEAKALKAGDKIIIQAVIVAALDTLQAVWCEVGGKDKSTFCASIDDISIPAEPKYNPYRRFKKGDIVRVVAWRGRDIARVGMEGCVVEDESSSKVELAIDGWTNGVFYPACHIELVTPVEERIPYAIDSTNTNRILQYGQKFAEFEDDDAARACCNMLNEKHRKEKEVKHDA